MTSKPLSAMALGIEQRRSDADRDAPAVIHSPALVSETPPVGIILICGSGARRP
jgi:hypothetical protein